MAQHFLLQTFADLTFRPKGDAVWGQEVAAKLGLNASPTRVVKIFSPPPKTGGVKWQGEEPAAMAQRLADLLRERKLI